MTFSGYSTIESVYAYAITITIWHNWLVIYLALQQHSKNSLLGNWPKDQFYEFM